MAWSCNVYNKEGNQINWLDNWSNKSAMIRCAKEHIKFHRLETYPSIEIK